MSVLVALDGLVLRPITQRLPDRYQRRKSSIEAPHNAALGG